MKTTTKAVSYKQYVKVLPATACKHIAKVLQSDEIGVYFTQPVPVKDDSDKYICEIFGVTWEDVAAECAKLDFKNTLDPESWYSIEADFERWQNMSCTPTLKKLPEGHVFDEDKSVRWNREEVVKHNQAVDNEVANLNKRKNELRQFFYSKVATRIQCYSHGRIPKKKAMAIAEHTYNRCECYFSNYMKELNNLMGLLGYLYDREDNWNNENVLDYWD